MQNDIFHFKHSSLELTAKFGQSPVPHPNGRILCINQLQDGEVRSRKVVSRSNYRPTGKYPSWKMQRHIHWESHNELNAFRLLDANPLVIRFQEQPLEIKYELDGEQRSHFPDVLVETRDGKELWEIKPAQWAATDKNRTRAALMMAAAPQHGFQYRLIIAEDLRQVPRLNTVLTLLRWGRNAISFIDRERLRTAFEQKPSFTWGDVLDGVLGQCGRQHCSRLILEGAVHCDTSSVLARETPLTYVAAGAMPRISVEA